MEKIRAAMNRTINLSLAEIAGLKSNLLNLHHCAGIEDVRNRNICQDMLSAAGYLPRKSVDLLFLDPPYNLARDFNGCKFKKMKTDDYTAWFESWFIQLLPLLKEDASVYICGDWETSASIYTVARRHLVVRNRITWEREKGRGAKANWKNASEDIWFCTASDKYKFNVERVKLRRKVLAPYRNSDGSPKDWDGVSGGNYRLTYPSNLWTDITVPFWSMPENTDHPTQKPEKLLAKLILASSDEQDIILDPFAGSGTTAVVAKKLNRSYISIEQNLEYCCLLEKRLNLLTGEPGIQGYADGVFWERNSR